MLEKYLAHVAILQIRNNDQKPYALYNKYKRYSLSFPVPNDGLGVEWSLLLGVHNHAQHIWCILYYYIIQAETQIIFLSTDGTYKIFLSDMFQITARSFVHSSTQCVLLSARYAFRSVPVYDEFHRPMFAGLFVFRFRRLYLHAHTHVPFWCITIYFTHRPRLCVEIWRNEKNTYPGRYSRFCALYYFIVPVTETAASHNMFGAE